jgi:hypothetical protein
VRASVDVALAPGITRGMTLVDPSGRLGTPNGHVRRRSQDDRLVDALYAVSAAYTPNISTEPTGVPHVSEISTVSPRPRRYLALACGADDDQPPQAQEYTEDNPLSVALVLHGTLGDKSFFDSALPVLNGLWLSFRSK